MTAQDFSLVSEEAVAAETGHFLVTISITPFVPLSPLFLPGEYDKCKKLLISRERQPSNSNSMKAKERKKANKREYIPQHERAS